MAILAGNLCSARGSWRDAREKEVGKWSGLGLHASISLPRVNEVTLPPPTVLVVVYPTTGRTALTCDFISEYSLLVCRVGLCLDEFSRLPCFAFALIE